MSKKIKDIQLSHDVKLSDSLIGMGMITIIASLTVSIIDPNINPFYRVVLGFIVLVIGFLIRKYGWNSKAKKGFLLT